MRNLWYNSDIEIANGREVQTTPAPVLARSLDWSERVMSDHTVTIDRQFILIVGLTSGKSHISQHENAQVAASALPPDAEWASIVKIISPLVTKTVAIWNIPLRMIDDNGKLINEEPHREWIEVR